MRSGVGKFCFVPSKFQVIKHAKKGIDEAVGNTSLEIRGEF